MAFKFKLPEKPSPIALIVAVAMFMEMLDSTIITTALPKMAQSFHVTPTGLSLGITAYMLTVACLVPLSGWMADRFGTRTVFCSAVLAFVLSSILCATSVDQFSFVLARVLQGAAAGMMSPIGRLIVIRTAEKKNLVAAIAVTVWPALIAPVIGPPLGGLITDLFGWRWIFLLNLPIGILGLYFAYRILPEQKSEVRRPFDTPGFLLTAASLAALLGGFDRIGAGGGAASSALLITIGLALGAIAVSHMHRAEHPVIDLSAMKVLTFRVATVAGSFARVAIGAVPFLIPLLYQEAFGMTAFSAGLFVLTYMAGNLFMKAVTTPILRQFGFRNLLIGNTLIMAASILILVTLGPGMPFAIAAALLFVCGSVRSMELTALATLTFADVEGDQRTGANTLAAMAVQLGFSLGVALGAAVLGGSSTARGTSGLDLVDFRIAFVVAGLVAIPALFSIARLPRDAGAEVSGHRGAGA
jgi:EmrB/QacA subfamily drug resistance transporter